MHAQTARSQRRKGTSLQVFGTLPRPLSSSPVTLTASTFPLCLSAQPDSWVLCGFFFPGCRSPTAFRRSAAVTVGLPLCCPFLSVTPVLCLPPLLYVSTGASSSCSRWCLWPPRSPGG
uniref:Uncharacterized protein n=1 Tax=Mustela putorius furo TaxID=9669 RepID=M3XQM8_MUSPF